MQTSEILAIQKYLEQNDFDILNFKFERIPNDVKNIPEDEREVFDKLLEKSKKRRCYKCVS